jgi:anti-sigma B factor antagonist
MPDPTASGSSGTPGSSGSLVPPAAPSGHLIVQVYEKVVLITIARDRLLDGAVITAISAELTTLLDRYAKPSVVLDFQQVAYLSSAMVGKLIAFYKGITALKGRIAIAGVRPDLMPMFKITQVDKLMRFYTDLGVPPQAAVGCN